MFTNQDPGALIWVVLIIAAAVTFWRTVIKLVIVVSVALVVLGFVDALRSMH